MALGNEGVGIIADTCGIWKKCGVKDSLFFLHSSLSFFLACVLGRLDRYPQSDCFYS